MPKMRVPREFEHGAAECLTQSPLFIGCRGKIEFCPDSETGPSYTDRGLALVEIEFLVKYAPLVCVYARATSYLPLLARMFPHTHFHAFECEAEREDSGEYDPAAPAIRCRDYGANVTPSVAPLSRENSAGLRGADALVLHPSLSTGVQLLLHTRLCPRRSLCGDVPDDCARAAGCARAAACSPCAATSPMSTSRGSWCTRCTRRSRPALCIW